MLKSVSSITNAIGALNFKGTWDANANSPALASSVGTKGDYYVVGTAGSTNLNGISNWGVGDLATFNGSVWQRVEGGADLNGVNLSVSGTSTLSGLTASTALALNASKEIVSVTNTGTGNNVLATAPTLVGNVTLSTGNLVIGTSGKGITDSTGAATLNFASTGGTFNKDVVVNSLTVGKGASAISTNSAFGVTALQGITTGSSNSGIGNQAGYTTTTGVENVFLGSTAGYLNLSGSNNTILGSGAGYTNSTGSSSTMVGSGAGYFATGGSHTLVGTNAGGNITTGTNNTVLGTSAATSSSVINLTTQSNRVVVGDANVTNAYILVAWTVTSDARDKADVIDAPYGLNFVNELRPITYKWDKRDKYENNTPNGTHKETKTQLGFLAQDVIALEKKYGGIAGDLLVADDETEESLKITETKMIPILVKALQELNAKFEAYVKEHP